MENIFNRRKLIPIFFATDDNYMPFLDVALVSLIKNASNKYDYEINILNTGLNIDNMNKMKRLENEYVKINFCDISNDIEDIKNSLRGVYHFSVAMYYRLFIEKLFPQYDKVLYLDCDIVVLGDISELFNINLGNNLVGAITEQVICSNEVFRNYVKTTMDIEPENYFNSGILVMNLAKFRKANIGKQFCYLIGEYNFDVVDPDQAYLNVLCKDRVKYIANGWNKASLPNELEGELNVAHYALYKKPWQYDDVLNGEFFWEYAKLSPFYDKIIEIKNSFDDVKRAQKEEANKDIVEHAMKIIESDKTFSKVLNDNSNAVLDFIRSFEIFGTDAVEA